MHISQSSPQPSVVTASNHMTRLFAPFPQKLGVTYRQYLVLVVLWERGPQGVGGPCLAATNGFWHSFANA
jgi:hypothetical protein